eukprot:gene37460-45492_t
MDSASVYFLSSVGIIVVCVLVVYYFRHRRQEGNAKELTPLLPAVPQTPELDRLYPDNEYYQNNSTPDEYHENPLLSDLEDDDVDEKYIENLDESVLDPNITPLRKSQKDNKLALTVDEYVLCLDRYIRRREDFYAPGYIYNIDRLSSEIPPPKELKIRKRSDFVTFLKSRREFRVIAGGKSLELTALTPYRTEGRRVFGCFHCVVRYCDATWESDNSYCDRFQLCWKCGAKVFPFEQQELRGGDVEAGAGLLSAPFASSSSGAAPSSSVAAAATAGAAAGTPNTSPSKSSQALPPLASISGAMGTAGAPGVGGVSGASASGVGGAPGVGGMSASGVWTAGGVPWVNAGAAGGPLTPSSASKGNVGISGSGSKKKSRQAAAGDAHAV